MKKIKKVMFRFSVAFRLFGIGFINPSIMQKAMFKMLSDILLLVMKVGNEKKHLMTHIAIIHPDGENQEIVSIWAGAGIAADPLKRISELLEENIMLKTHISKLTNNEASHEKARQILNPDLP